MTHRDKWHRDKPPKGYVDAYADFLLVARDYEEDSMTDPPIKKEMPNERDTGENTGDKR